MLPGWGILPAGTLLVPAGLATELTLRDWKHGNFLEIGGHLHRHNPNPTTVLQLNLAFRGKRLNAAFEACP